MKGIKRGSELEPSKWNIMIYGAPGSGKTTFASYAPRPLFLELDTNGEQVLIGREDVGIIVIPTVDKMHQAVQLIERGALKLAEEYDTLVIDTLSEYQQRERIKQASSKGDVLDDTWLLNEGIYGRNNFRTREVVQRLTVLPFNTVWICHQDEKLVGPDGNQSLLIRPALSDKLLGGVLARMDGCFLLEENNGQRSLKASGGKAVLTKSRFGDLPLMRDPHFNKLLPALTRTRK